MTDLTRLELDEQMAALLTRLKVTPDGATASYNGGGGKDSGHPSRILAGQGNQTQAEYFAGKYGPPFAERGGCRDDYARELVVQEARAYLGMNTAERTKRAETAETEDERMARMLVETEGWTVAQVEQSAWRITGTRLRKLRTRDGREADRGRKVQLEQESTQEIADRERLMRQARSHRDNGMSIRQIAMMQGRHKTQVERDLKRASDLRRAA